MSTTKIILAKDITNLGEEGDVKEVKRGYARNFLIPNGFALDFTLQNRNLFEKRKAILEKKKLEKKVIVSASSFSLLKEKLEADTITLSVPSGDKGRLYGTVTNVQIAAEIAKKGYSIDKKSIELKDHIKLIGKYKVSIHLYHDIYAEMNLIVEPVQEEKKTDTRQKNTKKKRSDEDTESGSAE